MLNKCSLLSAIGLSDDS